MENKNITLYIIVGVVALIAIMFGLPMFSRYQTLLNAQNELKSQNYLKQVAIATAEAKNESAKFEAEAEITRAKGVAQANQIIGDSLKGNESYLKYLWINNMGNNTGKDVIYVPTEANLPILEAGKR